MVDQCASDELQCFLKIAGTLRKKGFLGKAGVTNEYRLCGGGFKLR